MKSKYSRYDENGIPKGTGTYREHDWLYKRIAVKKKSFEKIAEECKVGKDAIRYSVRKLKIPVMSISERMLKHYKDHPEARERASEKAKKRWQDSREREKASKVQKMVSNRPEVKAKRKMRMKELWADPEWRKRQIMTFIRLGTKTKKGRIV